MSILPVRAAVREEDILDIETATREKSKRPAHRAMESNRILFIMGA